MTMKQWIWAALAVGLLAIPFEDASARGGRRGGGISTGSRKSRRSGKKNQKKMIERMQDQNRLAVLADAARDRR